MIHDGINNACHIACQLEEVKLLGCIEQSCFAVSSSQNVLSAVNIRGDRRQIEVV